MTVELINPVELAVPQTYAHAAVATGRRLIFIAGQVAEDRDGNLIGVGDLRAQAELAFENVGHALASAGARPEDVAKLTIFVSGYREEYLPLIEEGRVGLFGHHKPADTLLGVESLARPEWLIEVDAIAVVDGAES